MANKINNKDTTNLVEKVVAINKVSKTIKGGKTFSFTVLVVVGDKKGKVGFGYGKAREVNGARAKAFVKAKKALVKVPLREGRTLHHDCLGSFRATKVVLRPAVPGTGIIAGGPMRAVFECLGLQDVVAKKLGSSNPKNVVMATFEALSNLNSPKHVADRRGKHISEVVKKRNITLKPKTKKSNNKEKK